MWFSTRFRLRGRRESRDGGPLKEELPRGPGGWIRGSDASQAASSPELHHAEGLSQPIASRTKNPDSANSLTIYNAASSPKTLGIRLIVAALGMPCVLAYAGIVYWTFRGKARLDRHSY